MKLATQTVLLTGATGFLGTHLRRRLAELGAEVTLFVQEYNDETGRDNETILEGDVTQPQTIPEEGYDAVVHLAAQTSVTDAVEDPLKTWEINATGTVNVLQSARLAEVDRFLYASTASIYGIPQYLPIDESHPLEPVEPYGLSKLAGDRAVRTYQSSYDVPTVTARFFNVFGPGQPRHNVVPTIITQALQSDTVELGNLEPSRDFVYIDDAVEGLLSILEDGDTGEAYNIGRGEDIDIRTLAESIVAEIDSDISIESVSDRQRSEGVEIDEHRADISKIQSLGWEPDYDIQRAARQTIDWYSEE